MAVPVYMLSLVHYFICLCVRDDGLTGACTVGVAREFHGASSTTQACSLRTVSTFRDP